MDISSSPRSLHQKAVNPHQLAPPSWTSRGEAWWLILSLVGKLKENFPSDDQPPPPEPESDRHHFGPGHFDPLEALSRDFASLPGVFRGGMGSVQLIRYHSSPVGPYDELLIIPGDFSLPAKLKGGSLPRITRIYVSTLQSVLNGRYHWNIPKHLAHFEFTPGPSGSITISVYALQSYTFTKTSTSESARLDPIFMPTPFFSTIIHPWGLKGVQLPIRLNALPGVKTTLFQPPLKEGDKEIGMVSTKYWKKTKIGLSGRVKLCKVEGGLNASNGQKRFADGKGFPDFKPYRICIHWKNLVLNVPEALNLNLPSLETTHNEKTSTT
ncbi:hypothetical protein CROQUDRAFT_37290 [Cronartium quercuum f. sp. fusiforme G11]|uniref:Uncharacterized protein n=1 Tax=Cronartium quercuum f. sp. fusiforme G11 TaxID=708437 RepID=A0A9P6THQ3_9BASI|nr:hypothetical protein CROQUDRAFT_37290 [Cronartium quercuum f. sp. fusiforme G11]